MDDLIKKAIISAANIEVRYFESLPDSEHRLSDGADERIRKRIIEERKPAKIPMKKLVALLIAAALLMALTVTAVAYREQIGNFLESVFEDHINLKYDNPPASTKITPISTIYIPNGFAETKNKSSDSFVHLRWENNDLFIELFYSPVKNGSISFDTENSTYEIIYLDGTAIYQITSHPHIVSIWEDGKHAYSLSCPEELGLAEIEKIIRSIEPIGEGD